MKDENRRLDKKWCMYCKTFIVNNKPSLDMHEQGFRHKSQVRYYLRNTYRELDREKREQERQKAEYKKIEKAALKQEQLRQATTTPHSSTTIPSYPTGTSFNATHYPQMPYYDYYSSPGSMMYHQTLSGMDYTNLTYGYNSVEATTFQEFQQQQDSMVSSSISSTEVPAADINLSSSTIKSTNKDSNIEDRRVNPKTHPYGEWVRVAVNPNEDNEKETSNSSSDDEVTSAEEEPINHPTFSSLNDSSLEMTKDISTGKISETVTLGDPTSSPMKSDNLFKKRSLEDHQQHRHRRRHKIGWE